MGTNYLQMIKKAERMPIYTDVDMLDGYCEYLLNDRNKYITYSNLSNLKDYVSAMDPKYITTDAKMARYRFLEYYLEARLDKGITKRELAVSYVMDHTEPMYQKIIRREILNSIDPDQLGKKDIEFMNEMIFCQLNLVFMHKYQLGMTQMIEDVNNNNFGKGKSDCENAIQFLHALLSELTRAQRRSRQENRFNLSDAAHFRAMVTETYERLQSSSTFLKTGYQGLNSMLSGGFENARVYNFIGATGGFKSGLLLNLMRSIKLYNKDRQRKDPTKRPTILFLSQENNIWETIVRIFSIFSGAGKMKSYSLEDVFRILDNGGFSIVEDDADIDIEFRYYGNMDIGVADIRGIYEELDNEGREVICVIQDYIERLRPPTVNVEKRVQLNDVSNQLHDLAIELDIPILTASQFNRTGVSTIESIRDANKYDAGKSVGMKDISESFGMLKNFDANISIVVEYDQTEERFYLSFRALKYRGDDSEAISYFLQPFVGKKSKILLQEDIDTYPVYRESLSDENALKYAMAKQDLERAKKTQKQLITPEEQDTQDEQDFMDIVYADQKRSDDQMAALNQTSELLVRDDDGFYRIHKSNPMEYTMIYGTQIQFITDIIRKNRSQVETPESIMNMYR